MMIATFSAIFIPIPLETGLRDGCVGHKAGTIDVDSFAAVR
jgi:hypothetical protein